MTPETPSLRRSIVLTALFMFLTVLVSGGMIIYVLADPDIREANELASAAYLIDSLYETDVDWQQASRSAVDAMFANLDRFSGYIPPRRWKRVNEEFSGAYSGIGVTVTPHDSGLMIISVRENGPAAEKGILSGDIIIAADSIPLAGLDIDDASDLLRGPENTDVVLTIFRPVDQDTLSFTVTRRKIDLIHIPFAGYTADSVLYIRLLDFEAGASRDLRAAVDSLLPADTSRPYGLILDLRGNPGGLLSEAYSTANLFLESGQLIVGTDGRSRWEEHQYESSGHDITGGLPIAVLVDRGSASAAEIVAGSLQQLDRAELVGDTTFGKGLVQGFTRLADGGAARLTISRYFLNGRVYLNQFDSVLVDSGSGLKPDYVIHFRERDPFPRALERSLLLQEFASRHQDEITSAGGEFALGRAWLNRFRQFTAENEFDYVSGTTEKLQALADQVALEHSASAVRFVDRLLKLSREDDARQFERYSDYIAMRLKQLAFERQSGVYTAYARAIVPARRDIQFAASLLKERR